MDTVKKYRSYLFYLFIIIALLLGVAIALLFRSGIFLQQPIFAVCLLLTFFVTALLFYGALHVASQWELALQRKSIESSQDLTDNTSNYGNESGDETKNHAVILAQDLLASTEQSKNLEEFSNRLLINFSKKIDIVTGLFYCKDNSHPEQFAVVGSYAYFSTQIPQAFHIGEGLAGQVVKSKRPLVVSDIPTNYISIVSGLGVSSPRYLLFLPLPHNGEIVGLLEIASFQEFNFDIYNFFDKEAEFIAEKFLNLAK